MLKVNKVHQAVLVAMSAGTASSALHAPIEESRLPRQKSRKYARRSLAVQAMDSQREIKILKFTDYVKYLQV